jgi:hypothetical protein
MENLYAYLSALPSWLTAMIVIVAGWLTAILVRFLVARLLALLHFNQLCERTGASDVIRKGGVAFSPAQLTGRGLYWIILIGVFLEAARLLDIGVVTEFRQRVVAALPAVLSAALVLVIGLLAVAFLSGFVRTLTRNAGSPYANLWARITRCIGVVLVLAVTIEQAGIRGTILGGVIQIVIAAIAFGMALAFGLGCKDMARNAMEKLLAELKDRHRDATKPDMEG